MTATEVGNILWKASQRIDALIHQTLDDEDGDEELSYIEKAHALIQQSNGIIMAKRLQKLKEIYAVKTLGVPRWFRDVFKGGDVSIELVPTFGTVIGNACPEFSDMLKAKLSITLSPVDTLLKTCRPQTCQIRVSENIQFMTSSSTVTPNSDVIFPSWRRPLTFIAAGDEVFCKRRVSLSGMADERVEYRFGKKTKLRNYPGVRIIIINNKSDKSDDSTYISGIYRRLMSTKDKYLTWKFVL